MAVTADSYRVAFGKRLKHVIQATDMKYRRRGITKEEDWEWLTS